MVDLLIAVVAVVVLIAVAVVLVRAKHLTRTALSAALAVAVVAAGTFAVSLYRSQTADDEQKLPKVIGSAPAKQGLGTAVLKVEIPMGTGDKYPQGAMWLQPPGPGADAYTGDISLLCATPGKDEKVQNCSGGDERIWSAEPLEGRATIGVAGGDPFADPAACAEGNGVKYQDGYLQLAAGKAYCLHKTGDDAEVFVFRIPSFPAEKPLPARIDVEVSVVGL
ncbi:hypothetical protein M1L60_27895 [Actinoplanes sp. TRM 88003]|uniref:Uncharacterized protein n=1 Tax=Paractinoplanes aksuensis TaxID=2939490 RepID=A0ABT1DU98_9ACTN|nr:hypothetical protein [Actinoplanes aksuensis]MCO8274427.1 hypothetical protein [Actinoplanes aksuensis]